MRVTIHIDLTEAHWLHAVDQANRLSMTPQEYIAGAAVGAIDDSLFELENS